MTIATHTQTDPAAHQAPQVAPRPRPAAPERLHLSSVASYLPARIVTNHDWAALIDTSDEWIRARTGIGERHWAAEDQATSDLAAKAGLLALERAGLSPLEIDLVLIATATPDSLCPTTACRVQALIGATNAAAMDVAAACSGFIYAMHTADAFVRAGLHRRILVVGAETLSRFVNETDRTSCVLFGDGAGAVVVGGDGPLELLYTNVGADGTHGDMIEIPLGSRFPPTNESIAAKQHTLRMNGAETFKAAVRRMADEVRAGLDALGMTPQDLDWLVPHQANSRIIQAVQSALGVREGVGVVNIERTANTSSASIPLAIDNLLEQRKLRPGHTIALVAFGGGTTWGCQIWRVRKDIASPRITD